MEEQKQNQKNHKEKLEEKTVILKEPEYLKLKEDAEKAKEYWDKLLRLQADFDNTRKRLEKEKQDFIKFANEGILSELLNSSSFINPPIARVSPSFIRTLQFATLEEIIGCGLSPTVHDFMESTIGIASIIISPSSVT